MLSDVVIRDEMASPWWSGADNWVLALAALVAAYVAWAGLRTWRKQLVWTEGHNVAIQVIRATYLLRDALQSVRNPFMDVSEAPGIGLGLPSEEADRAYIEAVQRAYDNRWKAVLDASRKLEEALLEAEVLWGRAARTAFQDIAVCRGRLLVALRQHLRWLRDKRAAERAEGAARQQVDDLIYDVSTEATPDPYYRTLLAAVQVIEDGMKPHLGR